MFIYTSSNKLRPFTGASYNLQPPAGAILEVRSHSFLCLFLGLSTFHRKKNFVALKLGYINVTGVRVHVPKCWLCSEITECLWTKMLESPPFPGCSPHALTCENKSRALYVYVFPPLIAYAIQMGSFEGLLAMCWHDSLTWPIHTASFIMGHNNLCLHNAPHLCWRN